MGVSVVVFDYGLIAAKKFNLKKWCIVNVTNHLFKFIFPGAQQYYFLVKPTSVENRMALNMY
jgi:hypothetical protein